MTEPLKRRGDPQVILLAGPNGAGKSTTARSLLKGALAVQEFVNADEVARGLSAFSPERVSLAAGRVMVRRLRELAARRASFGFETTLAGRSFAPWLARLQEAGYMFHLVFLWLRSADVAAARVAERVSLGGHHVPEKAIRRRYAAGILNFFRLYQPAADSWRLYDNSDPGGPRLVAAGGRRRPTRARERVLWEHLRARWTT
jgi:predicted ABC-type ATPase